MSMPSSQALKAAEKLAGVLGETVIFGVRPYNEHNWFVTVVYDSVVYEYDDVSVAAVRAIGEKIAEAEQAKAAKADEHRRRAERIREALGTGG